MCDNRRPLRNPHNIVPPNRMDTNIVAPISVQNSNVAPTRAHNNTPEAQLDTNDTNRRNAPPLIPNMNSNVQTGSNSSARVFNNGTNRRNAPEAQLVTNDTNRRNAPPLIPNMNFNVQTGSNSRPRNFISEICSLPKYRRYCGYFTYFGNCNNRNCPKLHSQEKHELFVAERATNEAHVRQEQSEYRRRNMVPAYCVYNKFNCCYNNNCNMPHLSSELCLIPVPVHVPEPEPVPQVVFSGPTPYLNATATAVASAQPSVRASATGSKRHRENNEDFVGSVFDYRTNLCMRSSCNCNKPHSISVQPRSLTSRIFDACLETRRVPVNNLLHKLNLVYYNQFPVIVELLRNRPEHFQHRHIPSPNGNLTTSELSILFNFIENCDKEDIVRVYKDHMSQHDYSIIYELFRRSTECSRYRNFVSGNLTNSNGRSNNCNGGYNCRCGHHGINAICYDDLFLGSCKCSENPQEMIQEHLEHLERLKNNNDDGFLTIMTVETKRKIQNLKNSINVLEGQIMLHLNRDGYVDTSIHNENNYNLDETSFIHNLPQGSGPVQLTTYTPIVNQFDLLRKQRAEQLNALHKQTLDSVLTPEDYNTLVKGKVHSLDENGNVVTRCYQGKTFNVWVPIEQYVRNSDGNYAVPNSYLSVSICLTYDDLEKKNYAVEHKWSIEAWNEYLNDVIDGYPIWMDYTFAQYCSMLKTSIGMFRHPMNTRKNWLIFLNHYNSRIVMWENMFNTEEFGTDDDDAIVYSEQSMYVDFNKFVLQSEVLKTYLDFTAYVLDIKITDDERVTGPMNMIHKMILNEVPKLFETFYELYKVNNTLRFATWIESNYHCAYLMKKEKPTADFGLIITYLTKSDLCQRIDLETYLQYPHIANEWIKEIIPKADNIQFEDYIANRSDLYQYYSTNYYLKNKSIQEMKQEISDGWRFNNTTKVTIFCSLLVLSISQLRIHRQAIIKSFNNVLNEESKPFPVNGLGLIGYSPHNKLVIDILAEVVKPNCDLQKVIAIVDTLENNYRMSSIDIDFESYQFVKDVRDFIEDKKSKIVVKKVELDSKSDSSDSDSDSSDSDSSDSDSDSSDSDSDSSDSYDDYKPTTKFTNFMSSEKELWKTPVVKKVSSFDLGFTTVVLPPSQKVFVCRNKNVKEGAFSGNPVMVGPITDAQYKKLKTIKKMKSLPSRLVKFNKGTKDEFQVVSIPVKSNTSIFTEFQSIIMEAFEVEDIEIRNCTTLDIDTSDRVPKSFKSANSDTKASISCDDFY